MHPVTPSGQKITKQVSAYSANDLTPVKQSYTFEFAPALTLEDALVRIRVGGPMASARLLLQANNTLAWLCGRTARAQAVGESISKGTVMSFLKPFRVMLPATDESAAAYAAQTEAILENLRAMPGMIAGFVSMIPPATDSDADDSDDE